MYGHIFLISQQPVVGGTSESCWHGSQCALSQGCLSQRVLQHQGTLLPADFLCSRFTLYRRVGFFFSFLPQDTWARCNCFSFEVVDVFVSPNAAASQLGLFSVASASSRCVPGD